MANTALNRSGVALLTNKSGGAVAKGDVVITDATTASSFTTTTSAGYASGIVWVVLEPNGIASNAVGLCAAEGWVPQINLSGSASLGDLVKTHSVAKQGVRHAAPLVAGDFAQVLGTGTTPPAWLFGPNWSTGAAGGPAGELGFASSTSSFTTTSTTGADITGVTVTVTVAARAINIFAYLPQIDFTVGSAARCILILMEDGTQIQGAYPYITAGSQGQAVMIHARRAPAAGSHTYKVQLATTAAHTARAFADATDPMTIQVVEV